MEDDLIDATENLLLEGLAISIKPMEGLALKMVATYGKVVSVALVTVPLWITLGGPPMISQAPTPQGDVPPHVMSQSLETVTHGAQVAAQGGSGRTTLAGTVRASCRVLNATLGFSTATAA